MKLERIIVSEENGVTGDIRYVLHISDKLRFVYMLYDGRNIRVMTERKRSDLLGDPMWIDKSLIQESEFLLIEMGQELGLPLPQDW